MPQGEKESLLSPLDIVSPCTSKKQENAGIEVFNSGRSRRKQYYSISAIRIPLTQRELRYIKDRPLAAVGMQLFHKESVDKEISLDDGLYMLSQYKLGPTSYTSLRQDLKLLKS